MDRNSRRINMKSADPAAYDQFAALTTTVAFNGGFRALMFTSTTNTAFSLVIGQNIGGSITTKNMTVNLPTGGGVLVLPISGERITATFAAGSCYALI